MFKTLLFLLSFSTYQYFILFLISYCAHLVKIPKLNQHTNPIHTRMYADFPTALPRSECVWKLAVTGARVHSVLSPSERCWNILSSGQGFVEAWSFVEWRDNCFAAQRDTAKSQVLFNNNRTSANHIFGLTHSAFPPDLIIRSSVVTVTVTRPFISKRCQRSVVSRAMRQ